MSDAAHHQYGITTLRSARPHILYLVHRVPYPPNRGDRIRSYHLLEFLSQRAHVHLATLADEAVPAETMQALQDRCQRVDVQRLGKSRWINGATSMLRGRSATEGLFWSPRLYQTVGRWSRERRFDAVVAFCSSMTPYLLHPHLRDVPAIVDLVDVDSEKWRAYAASAPWPQRSLFRLEQRRLHQLESTTSRRAAAVVLVSEPEADMFRQLCPNDHTYAVPNGVDTDYFHPAEQEGIPGRCVFVGALDYRANVDGVTWFVEHAWPQIRAQYPAATFAIVGRNPGPKIRRLIRVDGVEVIGSVPDVRPYLAQASVVVVPLRVARGIQNKILEAVASSRAVVASPAALEGLHLVPGEHAVLAQTADQWVHEVLSLLNDRDVPRRLARSGRDLVLKRYGWAACLGRFDELISRMTGDPARPTRGNDSMRPLSVDH